MHFKQTLEKWVMGTTLALLFTHAPAVADAPAAPCPPKGQQQYFSGQEKWKKVYSQPGKCSAHFPRNPEYIQQRMQISGDEQEMHYHVYVADEDRQAVYMVLIAAYPGQVDDESAVKNLEHFLNVLLSQSPKNKLVSANLVQVQGYPAMDFFIRNDNVYFRGRAIQANNTLYLLAMECESPNYQEPHFVFFIETFELHN
ncbi:MAG: hypothetical protein A3F09_00655 [Chlamydiae bacterium RIFCSPHIGHO2_12_FULL_49_11]|nr:MAG: hypothetical protein A3F09_00655 [Chlamydiae bacterium RIFCSPHIGHO2_12_FULL_49_11]